MLRQPSWGSRAVNPREVHVTKTGNPLNQVNLSETTRVKGNRGDKKAENDLRIIHYNCRGVASEDRLVELETALTRVKWDIMGISEVKRLGGKLEHAQIG